MPKIRGNGQGSIYKGKDGFWCIEKTWGYYTDENGKIHRRTTKRSKIRTKKEAIEILTKLQPPTETKAKEKEKTFLQIYDLFETEYERKNRSKSTLNCYRAAKKYFQSIYYTDFKDLTIEDWQECIDECDKGSRTKQNMRALCSLLYKYTIPRRLSDSINMSQFLYVETEKIKEKEAFSLQELDIIRKNIDFVKGADMIYCHCLLGFRPSELLELRVENYNRTEKSFIGGAKTAAGINRTVTLNPRIVPLIEKHIGSRTNGYVFQDGDKKISLKKYRNDIFYPALQLMGLPMPKKNAAGELRKITPHCCRHTFATLIKNINAPDKDKLSLMGHTSTEMLMHYQHSDFEALRKITDKIIL